MCEREMVCSERGMIRGAGAGAAMGASGEVKAVFLWIWAVDEGAYDTAVAHRWQSPV